ncbi:ATP-binding cassette domain-containing protein [Leucobacter soli]|uniref:ATP-binding cassette domain-containing protein n=1 Tax=Leucobacter soli TaxID=2812850 RepID=UPI003613280E
MRDGMLIDTLDIDEVSDEELVTLMVGRKVESLFPDIPHDPREGGLELNRVSTSQLVDVTLTARRGEVVGVTGLVGSGKGDIGRAAFGLTELLAGEILVDGAEISAGSPSSASSRRSSTTPRTASETDSSRRWRRSRTPPSRRSTRGPASGSSTAGPSGPPQRTS